MKEQYALVPTVTLQVRWTDLFGDLEKQLPEHQRRARWAQWLLAARKEDNSFAHWWTDSSACFEGGRCVHLRGRSWCNFAGLPCQVSPYLTFMHGQMGMACMGVGRKIKPAAQKDS